MRKECKCCHVWPLIKAIKEAAGDKNLFSPPELWVCLRSLWLWISDMGVPGSRGFPSALLTGKYLYPIYTLLKCPVSACVSSRANGTWFPKSAPWRIHSWGAALQCSTTGALTGSSRQQASLAQNLLKLTSFDLSFFFFQMC